MADARRRNDTIRAREGRPPATDDEFLTAYEAELTALLNPPARNPSPAVATLPGPVLGGLVVLIAVVLGRGPPEPASGSAGIVPALAFGAASELRAAVGGGPADQVQDHAGEGAVGGGPGVRPVQVRQPRLREEGGRGEEWGAQHEQ
jgi:hypothetical protein